MNHIQRRLLNRPFDLIQRGYLGRTCNRLSVNADDNWSSSSNNSRTSAGERVLDKDFACPDKHTASEIIVELRFNKGRIKRLFIHILRKLQHIDQLVQFLLTHPVRHQNCTSRFVHNCRKTALYACCFIVVLLIILSN
ncbi:hypothetical protein D3C75_468640 [compost metagenome]